MTKRSGPRAFARVAAAILASSSLGAAFDAPAQADGGHFPSPGGGHSALMPGNLLLSRSVYENDPSLAAGVTELPAGCVTGCTPATAGGAYPEVWNNVLTDESFGVTSKIFLDQLTPWGTPVSTLQVPNSAEPGVSSSSDQMVTSFSSKSELALNLSTRGNNVTFMGYLAPVDTVDVSNSNTPGRYRPDQPGPGRPTTAWWRN